MTSILAFHLVIAAAVAASASRIGAKVFWVAALAPAATVGWVLANGAGIIDGEPVTEHTEWVPQLGLDLSLRMDAFALVMLSIVGGIGVLVMVYASQYFGPEPGLGRFGALLVVFTGAMTGLVAADDLLLIFVFWELTSITSYGLIGFKDTSASARAAAAQALLVTGAGGLALLAGLVLLRIETGADSLSELAAADVGGTAASWAAVLILVGCFTKSAQVPFHGWLPGAMAAPTPVSAYLHSATMVKAGVFLVARLSPALATLGPWRPMTLGFGLATMCWGGYRSLRQTDLKLLLAYGTVSQLGMLIAVFGAGEPKLLFAGTALLVAHAVFKASLFMVVGIIDHSTHTREIDALSGVGRAMPVVAVAAVIAGGSMAGVIPLLGFLAKEAAIVGMLDSSLAAMTIVTVVFVIASGITAAYTLRFLRGGFADKVGIETAIHRPTAWFVAPAALLAVPTVVLGLVPALANEIVRPAAAALDPKAEVYELILWPGINTALVLSFCALALGGVLHGFGPRVEAAQAAAARDFTAGDVFARLLTGMLRLASRVVGVMQTGSLPLYLGVILLATTIPPFVILIDRAAIPDGLVFAESVLQVVVVIGAGAAALGLTVERRRFASVVLLGAVGFGSASLFVIQGAPDLALTQMLVETVTIAAFVLVLRHLPSRFAARPDRRIQATKAAIAGLVGIVIFGAMLTATADRSADPIDVELATRAYPEGDGNNVVNVTLVDFRGLDTVGEALVLAVAALGVVALVRAGRPMTTDRATEPGEVAHEPALAVGDARESTDG